MKHHRAVNLVDYVLRTVHKLISTTTAAGVSNAAPVRYRETGFDMRDVALRNEQKLNKWGSDNNGASLSTKQQISI